MITFSSTNGAIQAQQCLKGQVPFQIMPVLREISKGCGISVRFALPALEQVRNLLAASPLAPEEYAFYGITGRSPDLRAEPLS